jgi:DNA repair photolyase
MEFGRVGITEKSDASINYDWTNWALEKREPTILITKDIKKLLNTYPNLLSQPNLIVHATITGYGHSIFEQNVPKPNDTLSCLKELQQKERVVIRIDPIIPIDACIQQSKIIFDKCVEYGFKRFRISILDLYPHVLDRFSAFHEVNYQLKQIYNWDLSHSLGDHKDYMIHAPLDIRKNIIKLFVNEKVETAVCCEPGFDNNLCNELGVINDGCISRIDLILLGIKPKQRYIKNNQREFCNCLSLKYELCKTRDCTMKCLYCYHIYQEDKLLRR